MPLNSTDPSIGLISVAEWHAGSESCLCYPISSSKLVCSNIRCIEMAFIYFIYDIHVKLKNYFTCVCI